MEVSSIVKSNGEKIWEISNEYHVYFQSLEVFFHQESDEKIEQKLFSEKIWKIFTKSEKLKILFLWFWGHWTIFEKKNFGLMENISKKFFLWFLQIPNEIGALFFLWKFLNDKKKNFEKIQKVFAEDGLNVLQVNFEGPITCWIREKEKQK